MGKRLILSPLPVRRLSRNFVAMIGAENIKELLNTKIVCIGPVTAETAKGIGLNVSAVADVSTIDGLIDKLLQLKG